VEKALYNIEKNHVWKECYCYFSGAIYEKRHSGCGTFAVFQKDFPVH
jgi:hypothetical protein